MKIKVGLFLLFFINFQIVGQNLISIDSLTGFNCFDSITVLNTWRSHKTYFFDSTLKEDVRFRIWGDGCAIGTPSVEKDQKCFFKFQRQTYFDKDHIQEKEGTYGWYTANDVKVVYQLMVYNKKGRLLYVEKKKSR